MLTEEQNNFLKMLQKHGSYFSSNTIEKTDDYLWVEFDGMVYIPCFQFENLLSVGSGTFKDYPYLIALLKRKNLSQVRLINFFISEVDGVKVYEMIRNRELPSVLIKAANRFGEPGH